MLNIEAVNHVGIRIRERVRSVEFYRSLGFELKTDTGFDQGHLIVMRHPGGVVLNLLGPATSPVMDNILMDAEEKHCGITHVALTVKSLDETKAFLSENNTEITGSFSFGGMSAVFIRDPDRNVIELDAYTQDDRDDMAEYSGHL